MKKNETVPSSNTENFDKEVEYEDIVGHLHGDSDFSGPVSKRKCTNVFFLIAFIILNLGLIGITVYILIKGDPNRLSKGHDIRGEVCGLKELSEKRFMYFPNSTDLDWSLCVTACPYYYFENYYCIYNKQNPNKYYPEWGCYDAYQTTAYGFFCVPAEDGRKLVLDYLGSTMQVIKIATADLILSWDVVIIAYLCSILLGSCYLLLMRISKVAKYLVLASIFGLIVLSGVLVFLLYKTGARALELTCGDYGPVKPSYCDTSSYYFYLVISIVIGVILTVYVNRVFKKYKSFGIGMQMIGLTSKPLRVMKELAIFPIIQILFGSGILVMLIALMGYNLSTFTKVARFSEYIPGGRSVILEYTALERYMLTYNAAMSLWLCNFIVDLGKFVMSGGVSTWYFSRQKSVLYGPLYLSLKYALRYHIGSIALGSLLKLLKLPISFLFLPKLSQYAKTPPASTLKVLLLKFCYCIKLYNRRLRYITDFNYTFLAIFADDYSESGKKAYHLIRRNYIRIGRPAKIGTFIINMMKWVIIFIGVCVSTALIIFPKQTLTGQQSIELTGLSGPIFVSFVLSWFVGEVFGGALEVSLNTVLLCAACDEEMFAREQRFVEADLLEYMDGIGEEQNLYHRENKYKVKVGFNEEKFNYDDPSGLLTTSRIVPDNTWRASGDASRIGASSFLDVSRVKLGVSESNEVSRLENIQEVSIEDEPQVAMGRVAKFVEDQT